MENENVKWYDHIVIIVVALSMMGLVLFGFWEITRAREETRYPMCCVVENVSAGNDTVTIRDFNGNLWQFKGIEDWETGDICACIMSTNGTEEITDDEIVSVKYSGFFDGFYYSQKGVIVYRNDYHD